MLFSNYTTMSTKPKIIVIVGPTASGKSEFAVKLAKKYDGEILSVDSRQIYRGMDIGTGKIEGVWENKNGKRNFIYKKVVHYGIDIASPKRQYSVSQFQKYSKKIIFDILKRGKLPILCGGTSHWLDAVVYEQEFPKVKPDSALRKKLDKLSAEQLYNILQELDSERAGDIDSKNPRRLIRAIEIVKNTGKPVPKIKQSSPYSTTWIGIKPEQEKLQKSIKLRLLRRIKNGMFHEIKNLHKQGVSWQRMWNFGLEYRFGSLYLQKKMSRDETLQKLEGAINQYSKRQMTWWKRNPKIVWLAKPEDKISF